MDTPTEPKQNPSPMKLAAPWDDVLWTVAAPVTDFEQAEVDATIMCRLLAALGGVGLAAPQLGLSQQLCVVRADPACLVLINPTVLKVADEESTDWEGCLSLAGFRTKVRRPKWVTVAFTDTAGVLVTRRFAGMLGRVVQHELDHLGVGVLGKLGFYCIFDRPAKPEVVA